MSRDPGRRRYRTRNLKLARKRLEYPTYLELDKSRWEQNRYCRHSVLTPESSYSLLTLVFCRNRTYPYLGEKKGGIGHVI